MAPSASNAPIARPQLEELLLASIERGGLTALAAPAGYGKSSLLAMSLGDDARTAWYTAQLWHAGEFAEPLVRAVRRRRPGFGRLTLALAARALARADRDDVARAQRLGATFAEELEHVAEPLRVVLDDVHLLEGDAGFAGFVTGLMRTLPTHVSLVISGRTLPDAPFAEWIAGGRALLIGVDQLRFDDTEVAQLAQRSGRALSGRQVAELRAAFEGWPAGIALSVAGGDITLPTRDGSRSATTALLIDANLALLDGEMVEFLERTAVFETLAAGVLERDSSAADVRRFLREFERRGVMLSVVKPAEVYRLHPMLREALLERVRARSGSVAVGRNHRWAGELLESAGSELAALFHFEQSADDARLARFVQEHAYGLFIAGLGERAGRIVRGLRGRGVDAPILEALVEGMLLRQRGEGGAAERLTAGIATAQSRGDANSELTLREVLTEDRLARGERPPTGELDELLRLARSTGVANELVAQTFAGWSHALAGDFAAARHAARAAFAQAGDDLAGRARVAILDAYAATSLGAFEEADAVMAEILRALEPSDHVVLMANTLVWYARFSLLWGDFGAARDYAEKGREVGRRLELPAELAGVELALAEVYARDGTLAECEAAAAAARTFAATAWYSTDRDRAAPLAALFRARALFRHRGPAAALQAIRDALEGPAGPPAQRVALLAEGAAYASRAGDSERDAFASRARAGLREALPGDALDALSLAASARILQSLRTGSANEQSAAVELQQSARSPFALLIERRGESLELFALEAGSRTAHAAGTNEPRGSKLTKRETEILEFLAEGLTNKEIAQRFSLSPRTVDTHVERVLSKLNATTRTRAVAAAIRAGIVATP